MKKVKVEEYNKPNYSTLKMITGKMLPAGLVIATMIAGVPTANIQANVTANADYSINEKTNFTAMGGGVPNPMLDATEEKPITVIINQVTVEFDVEPILENGRVLVPLRKIFEILGATVTWDEGTKTATAIKGNDTIVIAVNDSKMMKNGKEIALDVAAKMVDDRVLVPIRVVSEGLDCDVLWDEINNQVVIECKGKQDIIVTSGAVSVVKN